MIAQMKYGLKYMLGTDIAGPRLAVFPEDIFLVSYPRSGNTWMRFLLANLIYPDQEVSFLTIGNLVADPARASRKFLKSLPRPRILKSHYPFDSRYRKVVYLVRDPRDVAVSEYYFSLKKLRLDASVTIDQFVESFVAGDRSAYGSWWENVASWIAARKGDPGFLLVRYEDLLRETVAELSRVASFLAIDRNPDAVRTAVQRSSFERMRQLEKAEASQWEGTRDTRQDIPFVRSGKTGGWRDVLSPRSVAWIESAWAPFLVSLGYELSGECAEARNAPRLIENCPRVEPEATNLLAGGVRTRSFAWLGA